MDIEIWQSYDVIGVLGTLAYLASYFLLQMGLIRSDSYAYCLVNMEAACLVMISLLHNFNLASALIQISWIVISALGIFRLAFRPRRRRRRSRQIWSHQSSPQAAW